MVGRNCFFRHFGSEGERIFSMKIRTRFVIAVTSLLVPNFASAWVEGTIDSFHPLCGRMLPVKPTIEDVDFTTDVARYYYCGNENFDQCTGGVCQLRYLALADSNRSELLQVFTSSNISGTKEILNGNTPRRGCLFQGVMVNCEKRNLACIIFWLI